MCYCLLRGPETSATFIGQRSQSDQTADAIRPDGVRRSPTNQYSLSPKIYVPTRTIVERHSAAM